MQQVARRLVLPTLMTAVFLVVLIGLGTWQVHRLYWKQAIIARITAAEARPPSPIGLHPSAYEKVMVTGRYDYAHAGWFGADVRDTNAGPVMGYFQIVPLHRDDAAPPILVDRGWVPQTGGVQASHPSGPVSVAGYVRQPETSSWFSPPDDAAGRHFYTLNPQAIAAALHIASPAPFVIVALRDGTDQPYPAPAEHLPRPPNNHLSYILTWYGLAVALVVIFVTWVRGVARPRPTRIAGYNGT